MRDLLMTDASAPAVAARGLAKQFGEVRAVDGIDLMLSRGQTLGLLGGNGAGKTTTIAMLLGLAAPSAGTIHIFGIDMAVDRWRVQARLNVSTPYSDLPHRLTVAQNLDVFAMLYGVTDRKRRIAELAEDLDLTSLLRRPSGMLSAGQKTRVALAKALINQPDLLLLDEPTASLDPDTADWVRSYLEAYQARTGAAILLASHNMAEVERMCHQVAIMRRGQVVARGTPGELLASHGRDDLEDVFLDIARGTGVGVAA